MYPPDVIIELFPQELIVYDYFTIFSQCHDECAFAHTLTLLSASMVCRKQVVEAKRTLWLPGWISKLPVVSMTYAIIISCMFNMIAVSMSLHAVKYLRHELCSQVSSQTGDLYHKRWASFWRRALISCTMSLRRSSANDLQSSSKLAQNELDLLASSSSSISSNSPCSSCFPSSLI